MKYCVCCLQPDTRPNSQFSEGLCPACYFLKRDTDFSWNERLVRTRQIIDKLKLNGRGYDAVLGVSGGKDSIKLALWARDFFKLKILLVTVGYPPEQLTKRGAKNLSTLAELGFDLFSIQPSPTIWRELMKFGFQEHGNWAKSTEMALFSGVPQVAISQKIPLILWGENPGAQLGDLATMGVEGWDGNNLRNLNTISGGVESFVQGLELEKFFLQPYLYPCEKDFDSNNVQIIYLGWAMNNWGLFENGLFASLNNLQERIEQPVQTQDLLKVSSLDEDWVIVNQMIKYYKYGFGRATDYINERIRTKKVTREEGVEFVEEFDGVCDDKFIESFCRYIGVTNDFFWQTVRKFTNKNLFRIDGDKRPKKLFKVGVGLK